MVGSPSTPASTQDEEDRAREKLLARRNSARAIATQTAKSAVSGKSRFDETSAPIQHKKKQPIPINNYIKKQQRDTSNDTSIAVASPSPREKKDKKSRKVSGERRLDKRKMSSNRGETSSASAPPRDRGRHHYRDEFGRQPPPQWDYPPNGYYHRGPPPPPRYHDRRGPPYRDEGRWERDRGIHNALPPHPRDSRRPRSPLRYRDDRHYRDRRHRSRRDRSSSYSSRSRSRSISSRGSSSSFSSSESDSGRSYDSRSLSRSRSRSYSRSPSPQSPLESTNRKDTENKSLAIDQQKKDDEIKGKDNVPKPPAEVEAKREDNNESQSPSSFKGSSEKGDSRAGKRSRSRSASEDSRARSHHRGRDRKRKGSRKNSRSSRSRSRSSSISRSRSPGSYSSTSSHYSRRRKERRAKRRRRKQKSKTDKHTEDGFSKDQRTIFVSQLVMRTTERDLKKYFKRKVGCKVNDVILLRDRRNARNHKGCAYVEVGRIEDVAKAVAVSGQPPDFQRFPILIKASEAEKNYSNPIGALNANLTTTKMDGAMSSSAIAVTPTTNGYANTDQEKQSSATSFLPPLRDENGRLIESQKVYVGGLDPSVRQDHLYALFSPFGNLKKVQLQCHPNTQISRGYAFLTFHDPKVSNLAIQTMAGKIVTGRPLKTGWANQNQQSQASIASGCTLVTSDQFPDNAAELTQKALSVFAQMTGTTSVPQLPDGSAFPAASNTSSASSHTTALTTMAEQELDKAMGLAGTAAVASTQAISTVADARATMGTASGSMGATVADARASLAADIAARQLAAATAVAAAAAETKSAFIGNTSNGPSCHLLVHNMFDKDEETDPGWEAEIKEEFLDECSKFGKIEHAKVMHLEPGGKIFATFASVEGAKTCAENLAGRWFDKRQLRVDYMPEANPP